MIINGAEAGGGLLRAALPLSVACQEPLDVVNFRTGRREPGLGWPHLAVLWAMEQSGLVSVDNATMGSTDFSVAPQANVTPDTHITVDLDNPLHTFPLTGIRANRDYGSAEDTFDQQLNNRGGRGARGHAVSTPLLGLLPLTLSGATLSLKGGTETPGAPFVDALRFSTLSVLNALFNQRMGVRVDSRGTFGIGGGSVRAGNGTNHLQALPNGPQFITYWSGEVSNGVTDRMRVAQENNRAICSLLPEVELVDVAYDDAQTTVNQLLLVPGTENGFARDVSLCGEETIPRISGDAFTSRVKNELAHLDLVSRFHIEQVLLMAAIKGEGGKWRTERLTPHIAAVMNLIMTVTNADIRATESEEYTIIEIS